MNQEPYLAMLIYLNSSEKSFMLKAYPSRGVLSPSRGIVLGPTSSLPPSNLKSKAKPPPHPHTLSLSLSPKSQTRKQ
ncbi:hypothetical protein RJT34_11263 [Clitoria ternatea]|uniref:Uncharacterized protein n=1 Tax=Clitoria ternatea TaxID=43366 RepID=A0AAN9JLL7_CLITE